MILKARHLGVLGLGLLTAACTEDYTDPKPVSVCLKTKEYACRSGICDYCVEYGIACPKPLVLKKIDPLTEN